MKLLDIGQPHEIVEYLYNIVTILDKIDRSAFNEILCRSRKVLSYNEVTSEYNRFRRDPARYFLRADHYLQISIVDYVSRQ